MNIIAQAKAKEHYHLSEAAKWHDFIVKAQELGAENAPASAASKPDNPAENRAKRGPRSAPKSGVIYETGSAAKSHMEVFGEGMKTRDLLPIVRDAGIEVGGKNEVATLSARLSTSQMFELRGGLWFIKRESV